MATKPLRKKIEIANWISCWLYCFQRNVEYRKYSIAKQEDNYELINAMQGKFPKLAELYLDWGDISKVNPLVHTESFKIWYASKKPLFEQISLVTWISDPSTYVHTEGHLLIEVPFSDTKVETLENLKRFIDFAYEYRDRAVKSSTIQEARIANKPLPLPKYCLHGHLMNSSDGRLHKAIFVNHIRTHKAPDKPLTNAEIVLKAYRDPRNPFEWELTPLDLKAIAAGTFYNSLTNGVELNLIKRHRKDFEALVRNTIHGRFPDYS